MTSSPQTPSTVVMDQPALQHAYQRVQRQREALTQENAALRQEIRWIDRLLAVPSSVLSASQKMTLRTATKALTHQASPKDELTLIESWKLCRTVGQSKDTFLDNVNYLHEQVGVLRKQTRRTLSDDSTYTISLSIGATELLAHPERYHVTKPRNHGGERQRCPHCHSDRLQKKVTITCMGCGMLLDEKQLNLPAALQ